MEIYKGIIGVDLNDLTRHDDGAAVMSRSCYDKLRQKVNVLRRGGGLGSYALVEYATLPERYKLRYVAKYGDPALEQMKERVKFHPDQAAREWYHDDRNGIPTKLAEQYTINASVLRQLSRKRAKMKQLRNTTGNGTALNNDAILSESESLRQECGHTLPKSARLLDLIRRFDREGYACLVSGKLGNGNSRTVTKEMGRMIIALKRSMDPVYSVEDIRLKINEAAPSRGWREIKSNATIVSYLKRNKARWLDAELGDTRAKMELNRLHSTSLPMLPNSRWEGDGTKVNLYYRTYVDGKEKPATLYVYEYIDVASEMMLGGSFGVNENRMMLYEAFRNAVEGTGVFPYELVNDNQSSATTNSMKEWLSRYVRVARTTAPHNGPSKVIESVFGRFQARHLHKFWNFTGQNVTARKDSSRPNMDRILQNIASLPDRRECIAQYEAEKDAWNNSLHPDQERYPGMTRKDVYMSGCCPECTRLTENVRKDAWHLMSDKPVTYTNYGFLFSIDGRKYTYEVQDAEGYADLEWLDAHNGQKFFYGYDPRDLSEIRLYTFERRTGYRYTARAIPKPVISRDIYSQTHEQSEYIRAMDARMKEQRVRRDLENKAIETEFGTAPEQHGLRSPLPTGISRAEYDRIAAGIADDALGREEGPERPETYPDTVGKMQKRISGLDYEALRNM